MKILIIDGNNNMYRALHSYSNLQNAGKPVSIIFGMPSIVKSLITQFKPHEVYICWDGKKSKHRLDLLPTYKQGRKKLTPEQKIDIFTQKDIVMKLFDYLGVKQVFHLDMEADDWIYYLIRKFRKNNHITVVSTDKDFHQILRKNIKLYNTVKRTLIHHKNLINHFGYTPKQSVDYLCLTGDDSDNIPGYRGIGDKKAKHLIHSFGSIKDFLKSEKQFLNIDKQLLKAVYKVNRELIDLKYFYKKNLKNKVKLALYNKNPKLDIAKVSKISNSFNINTFKKEEFIKPFRNLNKYRE